MHMNKHLLKSRKYIIHSNHPFAHLVYLHVQFRNYLTLHRNSVRSRTSVVSSPSPVSSTEDCGAVLSIDLKWLEVAGGRISRFVNFFTEVAPNSALSIQASWFTTPCIRPEQRLDFSTTRVSPASLNWDYRTYLLGRCLQEQIGFQSGKDKLHSRDTRNIVILSLKKPMWMAEVSSKIWSI